MSAAPTPSTPPSTPARARPSGWWFALGGGLLVAAVASGIALFVWTLSGFLDTDVTVLADGEAQQVQVPTDGDRMAWTWESRFDLDDPPCTIVDTATGAEVALRSPGGEFRRRDGGGDWTGVARFDPGSGSLVVTCASAAGGLQLGPAPSLGSFGLSLVATIVVPLVLGGLGLVVLLVTGILWSTRATTRR
ncbi:hypothetical protein [Nocardioides sp. W7]|uniref:hypothetical protein n=1 Tax=Nocardioides sp. W7 TaxID=2931390 RepID=UPI001FD1E9D0|nr:hypothetical protein [Nocardioides sp. W7]